MWDKNACSTVDACGDNYGRALSSLALLLPLIAVRSPVLATHLIALTATSVWYWYQSSFASHVANGLLVATLPYAILVHIKGQTAYYAYVLAWAFYLILGECHAVGEVANVPSYVGYAVVTIVVVTELRSLPLLFGAVVTGVGAALLLLETAMDWGTLTWCVGGFDNICVGHLLAGISLLCLVMSVAN